MNRLRRFFHFLMQDSTGPTVEPVNFETLKADHKRHRELRERLHNMRMLREDIEGLSSTLADRDAALILSFKRAENAEKEACAAAQRALSAESEQKDLHSALWDARAKLRAATARAEMLNAAIQYACSISADAAASDWLYAWNEGDESADDMLREWMVGDDGKAVLGSAVVGRDGMPDVPAPVGRERPEPAPVQPAPGSVTPFTYKGDPPAVSLYPSPVGIFRQTLLQRSHCPNRVTRNSDNVETCNNPFARTKRCKGCPILTR